MSEVSIVKCPTYDRAEECVRKAVDLVGGITKVVKPGDRVVIKPNLVIGARPETAITTHPSVVIPLIAMCKKAGAQKVMVAENLMWGASARKIFQNSGMVDALRDTGANIAYLDEDEQVEVKVKGGKLLKTITIAKTVLDSDVFISVPKMKTSGFFNMSIMKNMFGLFSLEMRQKLHKIDCVMASGIMDLMRVKTPDLTVVDGVLAAEGDGPIAVDPLDMGILIAGFDPVAVESVTAHCMGLDPYEIETARMGECENLGTADLNQIKIRGESIEAVRKSFKKPNNAIVSRWPGVEVLPGGGCYPGGCLGNLGLGMLVNWASTGKLDRLVKKAGKITIVVGRGAPEPPASQRNVLIVGDCAEAHKDKGVFVAGCPPLPPAIAQALEKVVGFKIK